MTDYSQTCKTSIEVFMSTHLIIENYYLNFIVPHNFLEIGIDTILLIVIHRKIKLILKWNHLIGLSLNLHNSLYLKWGKCYNLNLFQLNWAHGLILYLVINLNNKLQPNITTFTCMSYIEYRNNKKRNKCEV